MNSTTDQTTTALAYGLGLSFRPMKPMTSNDDHWMPVPDEQIDDGHAQQRRDEQVGLFRAGVDADADRQRQRDPDGRYARGIDGEDDRDDQAEDRQHDRQFEQQDEQQEDACPAGDDTSGDLPDGTARCSAD